MFELDELQLQRIVRKKNGVKPIDIRMLHDQLVALSKAPRFELLQNLQIAQFKALGKSVGGSLGSLTLGELVEHGALQISGLPSMGGRRLKILNAILSSLAADSYEQDEGNLGDRGSPILKEPSTFPQDSGVLRRINPSSTPRFITTKTQEEFLALVVQLRRSELLSILGDQEIGKYWIPEDPRSPFEEHLTFGQLLQVDQDALLRKRSSNERKIRALINALKNALDQKPAQSTNKSAVATSPFSAPTVPETVPEKWRGIERSSNVVVWGLVKAVEEFLGSSRSGEYSNSLREIICQVEPPEFTALIVNSMFSQGTAQEILGLNDSQYSKITAKAIELYNGIVEEKFGKSLSVLREMLSGIGAYGQILRRSLGLSEETSIIEEIFVSILLRHIGASRLLVHAVSLSDFFTLDSTRVKYLVAIIESRFCVAS